MILCNICNQEIQGIAENHLCPQLSQENPNSEQDELMICPTCKKDVTASAKFCQHCGARFAPLQSAKAPSSNVTGPKEAKKQRNSSWQLVASIIMIGIVGFQLLRTTETEPSVDWNDQVAVREFLETNSSLSWQNDDVNLLLGPQSMRDNDWYYSTEGCAFVVFDFIPPQSDVDDFINSILFYDRQGYVASTFEIPNGLVVLFGNSNLSCYNDSKTAMENL